VTFNIINCRINKINGLLYEFDVQIVTLYVEKVFGIKINDKIIERYLEF
jgi:hypothetical protein